MSMYVLMYISKGCLRKLHLLHLEFRCKRIIYPINQTMTDQSTSSLLLGFGAHIQRSFLSAVIAVNHQWQTSQENIIVIEPYLLSFIKDIHCMNETSNSTSYLLIFIKCYGANRLLHSCNKVDCCIVSNNS